MTWNPGARGFFDAVGAPSAPSVLLASTRTKRGGEKPAHARYVMSITYRVGMLWPSALARVKMVRGWEWDDGDDEE
jgi:hypothetical protein